MKTRFSKNMHKPTIYDRVHPPEILANRRSKLHPQASAQESFNHPPEQNLKVFRSIIMTYRVHVSCSTGLMFDVVEGGGLLQAPTFAWLPSLRIWNATFYGYPVCNWTFPWTVTLHPLFCPVDLPLDFVLRFPCVRLM